MIVDGPLPVGDLICVVLIGTTLWAGYVATQPPLSVPSPSAPTRPAYPSGQPAPVPAPAPPQTIPEEELEASGPAMSSDELRELFEQPLAPEPGPTPRPTALIDPGPVLPTPPPTCTPEPDNSHKVLTVGDGNFGYSMSLHTKYPNWNITGTNYGNGSNSQDFVGSDGNLTLYTNVDARRLESGAVTGRNRYDAIIFNNPYAGEKGSQTAPLISAFKQSARGQLSPGGEIHINVTKRLLERYLDVAVTLGLPDNKRSTIENLPTFGQTIYYAPYIPQYSTGGAMKYYRADPTKAADLKNFVFH